MAMDRWDSNREGTLNMRNQTQSDIKERYARLVTILIKNPDVTLPIGKKGFGSSGLYVKGKLFTFLSHKNQLIVKLSRKRVDELVGSGKGTHWDPRRDGRVFREWLVLEPSSRMWLSLAKEGMKFASSI
jgi:hypothetical protein